MMPSSVSESNGTLRSGQSNHARLSFRCLSVQPASVHGILQVSPA